MEVMSSAPSPRLPPSVASVMQRRSRRAPAACELCRWKKVRCDGRAGQPCSNCNFEHVQCILAPQRPRKARNGANDPRPAPKLLPNLAADQTNVNRQPVMSSPLQAEPSSSRPRSQPAPAMPSPSDGAADDSSTLEDPRIWTSNGLDQSLPRAQDSYGHTSHSGSEVASTCSASLAGLLPDYIRPFPPGTDPEDIQYLQRKGALTLPDLPLRDACLRCYFQHVQPIYAIVDPGKVASQLNGTSANNEKLSLLLLHALIFVGSTWLDVKLVRKLGFLSRKAFRKSIHRKMRLLYDADYENDRLCLIQVFILWTFWFEGPNENKDGWHWIGVALSLSRAVGLHRALPGANADSPMNRQRRRLWWSLATRDVICSFALSRSPRISEADYNITMLEVEDFEFCQAPDMYPGIVVQPLHYQRKFAQICVHYVQLVKIFGRVCKAAYPESGSGGTSVLYSSQQLAGTDSMSVDSNRSNIDQLKAIEKDLDKWRQSIPEHLWHASNLPPDPTDLERADLVHRGLLSMMYYATMMILHRPQMLPASTIFHPLPAWQRAVSDPARAIVRFAALEITQIAVDFYEDDLVEFLAATCITCLTLASICHVFDMISENQALRSDAAQRLERCKAIFHEFSENQAGGQWALHVIDYILFRFKHKQREGRVDPRTNDNAVGSIDRSGAQENDGRAGTTAALRSSQTTYPPESTVPLMQPSTNVHGSTERSLAPEAPSVSALSVLHQPPFGSIDELLLSSTFDLRPLDNLANYTGPDLAWLDFSQNSEPGEGISWTDAGPV